MKKFIILILSAFLMISGVYAAENTEMTTIESIFYIKATHTVPTDSVEELKMSLSNPNYLPAFKSFINSCKPFNENIEVNLFGFDFSFNIKNEGWIESKCSYIITAKINSITDDVKTTLKITAPTEELTSIVPEAKCSFNKEQLALFADVVTEKSKSFSFKNEKMAIYRPATKDITRNDEKFISMMKKDNICQIVNMEDILNLAEKLFAGQKN